MMRTVMMRTVTMGTVTMGTVKRTVTGPVAQSMRCALRWTVQPPSIRPTALLICALSVVLVVSEGAAGEAGAAAKAGRTAQKPGAAEATPRHPKDLHPGPLVFAPQPALQETLACGVPVLLVENHDLPILDVMIGFRAGTRFLPVDRHAAARLWNHLWRAGGAGALPPDTLDARLAALGAEVSTFVGTRTSGVSAALASEDWKAVLPIWRDVVLHPRFDEERLAKARADRIRDIQAINNDPGQIADQRVLPLLYGPGDPAAYIETKADVEGVTRDDIAALQRRFIDPRNAIIGVSGDFDRAAMLAFLDELFRNWPRGDAYTPPVAEPRVARPQPGVYFLPGEYEQSQVRVFRLVPGLTEDSPDAPASAILSFALGYGRVYYRTRGEGLSYASALMLNAGEDRSTLMGFGSCRGEVTVRLLRLMQEELARIHREPLTAEEIETSRTFQIGMQVRKAETPAAVVAGQVDNLVRGRTADREVRRLRDLQSVGLGDVSAASERYLRSDSLVVLVLGNPAQLDAPLDSLGLGAPIELKPATYGE